jgi:predicted RNA-binding Zn-ribbon protein involved in translation (DUF1610 family)
MSELAIGTTHRPDEIRKFPCKQCGAWLEFNPGQASLACPYCGHQEHIPTTAQEIQEYDLESALLNQPHTEGWGMERRALHCENCGATTTFAEGQVAGACAFCGSTKVAERASATNLISPESLIPFKITRDQAVDKFRTWISSRFWSPNALKQMAQLAKISGGYLPFWTFDAYTSSHWTAEAGYYYYETETYRDSNGETQTRQVQRTRWEPAAGFRQDFFDDELVCASKGLPPNLISGVCPFDLTQLAPYDPGYLSGFTAEEYQVDLQGGWAQGKESIQRKVYSLCAGDVPGDTHRNLHVNTAYSQMTYKHTLLPVWVAAYVYNNRSWRFLVNGQTGKSHGEAPLSWWKIAAAVLLVIVIIVVIMMLRGRG